jgi:hypothetical protein
MDRPGWTESTDVIVVVMPRVRTLLWVPRDLLSLRFGMRINDVFARHGHAGLLAGLREFGLRVRHSVCLQRALTEQLLAGASVEVPVPRPLEYWYPLEPQTLLQDGRRRIRFDPPAERLEGVRIHEWLGARQGVGRYAGDLERIARQRVFVIALLRSGFDPRPLLAERPDLWSSTGPAAGREVAAVTPEWRTTMIARVTAATFRGQQVMLHARFPGRAGAWQVRRLARLSGATFD